MKAKSLILVVIALGCGLVASIGISQVMGKKSSSEAQPKPAQKVKILVAAKDLDIGASLTEEDVMLKTWPKEDVPEGALTSFDQLKGLLPRVRMIRGMPILARQMSNKINIPIPDGMRVIPVKVSANQVFGGIQPGDHVDVLVFLRLRDDETKKEQSLVRTVLKDVRLYGVNTKVDRILRDGKQVSVRTVELLLKPSQVNLVTLAEESGTLRLAMRKLDDESGDDEETLATMRDLLGKPAEVATDRKPESSDGSDQGSFRNFLTDMTGEATPEVAVVMPKHKMIVHTPQGLIEYRWDDPNEMPQVARVGFGLGAIPAPNQTQEHNAQYQGSGEPANGGASSSPQPYEEDFEQEDD